MENIIVDSLVMQVYAKNVLFCTLNLNFVLVAVLLRNHRFPVELSFPNVITPAIKRWNVVINAKSYAIMGSVDVMKKFL